MFKTIAFIIFIFESFQMSDAANKCIYGQELIGVFCGRSNNRTDCPAGYSCNIAPNDAYAVCCPNDPCKDFCKPYEKCQLQNVVCKKAPCLPVPTCVRILNSACPKIPPNTIGICVELCSSDIDCPINSYCCSNGCGHVCKNSRKCTYGKELPGISCGKSTNRTDCPKGYSCNVSPIDAYAVCCPTDPCLGKCGVGEKCELKNVTCVKAPCLPVPTCVYRCPLYKCASHCPLDERELDENNCPTCRCKNPCSGFCQPDETCELQIPKCPVGPCSPIPYCIKKPSLCTFGDQISEVFCGKNTKCPKNYMCNTAPDNSYAVCCPNNPCENFCKNGERCELEYVQCIRAPCPPIPRCVKETDICKYGDIIPGAICGHGPGIITCPENYNCVVPYIYAYSGFCCPIDPCQNFCQLGEKCILTYVDCIFKKPCRPSPLCYKDVKKPC